MKNFGFLLLALVFFGVAFYVYWVVAQENASVGAGAPEAARSLRKLGGGGASDITSLITQYQPYLTLASSIGGIASFLMQVRVWMRTRG